MGMKSQHKKDVSIQMAQQKTNTKKRSNVAQDIENQARSVDCIISWMGEAINLDENYKVLFKRIELKQKQGSQSKAGSGCF